MRSSRSDALAAALLALLAPTALAQAGDPQRGADVFAADCAECHSVRPGKHKKGPSLAAVWGRQAAAASDFKYSDALRGSGWQWDADTLRRYLTQPRKAVPGGTMKYDGLADARALEDLLAYLRSLK